MFSLIFAGFCPIGLYENPSGDKICWVGHAYRAGQSDAKTECKNQGFQGLAEARTENDWGFMNLLDACNVWIMLIIVSLNFFMIFL